LDLGYVLRIYETFHRLLLIPQLDPTRAASAARGPAPVSCFEGFSAAAAVRVGLPCAAGVIDYHHGFDLAPYALDKVELHCALGCCVGQVGLIGVLLLSQVCWGRIWKS
jgi:hypothetical protein